MIYDYSFPTNIHFGPGSILDLPDYLEGEGLARPLIVTDAQVSGLDFFSKIIQNLQKKGLSPEVFHEIHANPIGSDVANGLRYYQDLDRTRLSELAVVPLWMLPEPWF